jgi:hypothetical protein
MNKLVVYGGVIALIAVVLIGALSLGSQGSHSVSSSASSTIAQQGGSTGTLFSSEPYYGYSYLISPGNLSRQSKLALDGYSMAVNPNVNGSQNVTLSVLGTSISGTLTMSQGEKLYIVETSFGDDAPSYDSSLGDDGFVLVDANGYVVNTFAA